MMQIFNDCMGFAGLLLLNKLIWFLQQGLFILLLNWIIENLKDIESAYVEMINWINLKDIESA